ncbi:hypothetical protein [Pseudonocardia hierapolitana]|uniref:hypothetical protein n=1 Tax=Pseudonocardia hierapolitana TaxID=1128676 RepID=UPI001FE6E912|nr:hypothetical protein [Pseudonocardia hierapolitana]
MTTQVRAVGPAPNAEPIDGSAMWTTVTSTAISSCSKDRKARTHHRFLACSAGT